jgi:hypothetical protein
MKRPYTTTETAHLIARWPHVRSRVIAAELGRSYHSVRQKANWLGLKRTAKQKSAIYSGWSRQPKRASV